MDSTRRPSPSLLISIVAVFIALSGSAVALSGKNRVDHNDLQKHVVHRGKIHNQAVNSAKVQDDSLGAVDLAADSVGSSEIQTNGVTAAEINMGAVGPSEITANGVGSAEIQAAAVDTSELANGAVTVAKLNAVTGVIGVNFPSVGAGDCETVTPVATGVTTTDNLIVTPNDDFTSFLTWNARQGTVDNVIFLSACNPTDSPIDEPLTNFRYLAIHP